MTHVSWSDAWLDALLAFSHPGRMRRGRKFANDKLIKNLDIQPGEIEAKVKDGRKQFEVEIHFPPLDDASWDKIIDELASQAIYSARLLSGEIPPEVMEVFEEADAPLFPSADKLEATCTCPDWEVPCKHIAGVYYYLADQFEKDPFLLFYFRGRSKDELMDALRARRLVTHPERESDAVSLFKDPPLEEQLDHFWEIGNKLNTVTFNISKPPLPLPHFKRLGRPPFTDLDLYALLKPIYDTVTEKTILWAYENSDNHYD
jgi:uncharacterized Zn finger protein